MEPETRGLAMSMSTFHLVCAYARECWKKTVLKLELMGESFEGEVAVQTEADLEVLGKDGKINLIVLMYYESLFCY